MSTHVRWCCFERISSNFSGLLQDLMPRTTCTLTNNLPHKITNFSYRVTAYVNGTVLHSQVTRHFFELKPTEQQYRDMTFHQITCDQIDRLEISDPGRCSVGKLNRFSAEPGDCAKFTDVAPSSLVNVVKKR